MLSRPLKKSRDQGQDLEQRCRDQVQDFWQKSSRPSKTLQKDLESNNEGHKNKMPIIGIHSNLCITGTAQCTSETEKEVVSQCKVIT